MVTGKKKHKNKVGIIIYKVLKENVVDIKRMGDRTIGIKLVLRKGILKIVSA